MGNTENTTALSARIAELETTLEEVRADRDRLAGDLTSVITLLADSEDPRNSDLTDKILQIKFDVACISASAAEKRDARALKFRDAVDQLHSACKAAAKGSSLRLMEKNTAALLKEANDSLFSALTASKQAREAVDSVRQERMNHMSLRRRYA